MATQTAKVIRTVSYSTDCIICGEPTELDVHDQMRMRGGHTIYKVCDKCKEAVLKARKEIEENNKEC